ncbi:DHA2 family efflux MFS transporter permease subunit [Jiangella rhizosphaerae]|uniref:DHA2 family efflux MFS transporter permease subunit n=1 Tax=Jiangella rhizosphaerae TaxID=2293569 RepID=A0A418KWQ2_9ACTN|nr:DHA2 family efflux MFS transporter permease subunit [Jiangella rhizosphaerae]RIQ35919.1 DHA2 family efflux MFS transporter permease subunit [Jiangella rhizosphaerae]
MSSRSHRAWVLALTSIASLMVALDTLIVTVALSTIRSDLGATLEELEWTVTAYSLSLAVLLMTGSALGDRYGRKRLFAVGLVVFTAASAACALAPGIGWLIAARIVQGAGAAVLMPLSLAILSAAYPPERRGRAMGVFMGVTGLSVVGGPLLGGAITEGASWEWIFWLNVPLGLLVLPFVLTRIEESRGGDTGLDLPGLALGTAAAFGLVWGLVRGNVAGWGNAEVVTALVLGVALLAAFVAWERRASEPMLPLAFFRSRAFSAGNATAFLLTASLFGTLFLIAQFMEIGLGHTPFEAGLRLVPWTGCLMVVAPVAGALVDRLGERPFLVGGLLLQAGGFAWLALIAEPGMAYAPLVPPLVISGIGIAMAIPATQNSVVGAVPAHMIGKGAGTNTMLRQLGGVFGIAVLVAVFAGRGGYASPREFTDGFVAALAGAALLALAGAAAGLLIPRRRTTADAADGARDRHREVVRS